MNLFGKIMPNDKFLIVDFGGVRAVGLARDQSSGREITTHTMYDLNAIRQRLGLPIILNNSKYLLCQQIQNHLINIGQMI
jgi:hypothetical protein